MSKFYIVFILFFLIPFFVKSQEPLKKEIKLNGSTEQEPVKDSKTDYLRNSNGPRSFSIEKSADGAVEIPRNFDDQNPPKGMLIPMGRKTRSFNNFTKQKNILFHQELLNSGSGWVSGESWETGSVDGQRITGIGLEGSYQENTDSRLISPEIQLPEIDAVRWEKIALSFDEMFSLESYHDKGFVEVSTDGGNTWMKIDSRTGTSMNSWRNTRVFLDNYNGRKVQLAFHFISDENFAGQGWFIRNLKIEAVTFQKDQRNELLSSGKKELKSAEAGFSGTLNSLNSQNFPYIYMNVLLTEDGTGVSNLVKSDFQVFENDITVSNFNVVPPDGTSGSKLVDIVFLVDNSGSFSDYQNAARSNMESFVNQLATSGNDFALGLCRFGQSSMGGDPILEDNGQLTSNISYFKDDVWLRNVDNGGTEPAYWSIVKSAQEFNFRPGSQKIFIILADENPNQGGNTKEEAQNACLNKYIILFAMTNFDSAPLNDIAAATNGRSYDITDPFTDILSDISTSVNSNYMISYKSPTPVMDGQEREVRVIATNQNNNTTEVSGTYIPGAAPQIERTAETKNYETKGWQENTEFDITVEVTDSNEPFVSGVTLYYKNSTSAAYTAQPMTNTTGDSWTATIPSSVSTNPGVDYYITATDGVITSSLPKVEPNTNPFQIGILPNEKPEITHSAPTESYSPGETLTFDAVVTDNTNWVSSVTLFYRNPGELLYTSADMNNTSGDDYSVQVATPTSASGLEYYIVAEDDFGLKTYWASADSPQVISSGQLPNFSPHAISEYNWDSPLIIATEDSVSTDANLIYEDQEIYISFAYVNSGNATAGGHSVTLSIDGTVIETFEINFDTKPGYYNYLFDWNIGTLSPGTYEVSVQFDTEGEVSESDESDNEYSKTIVVLGLNTSVANLAPYTPTNEGWDSPLVLTQTEGSRTKSHEFYDDQDIFINLSYANFGEANAGAHVSHVYIDGDADTLYWSEDEGLDAGYYQVIEDYNIEKLNAGEHTFRFVIDATEDILESSEADNEISDTINVLPKYQPNLLPYQPDGWDASLVASTEQGTHTNAANYTTDDNIYIHAAFENNGDETSGPYSVRVYIDSLLYEFEDTEGLDLTTYKYIEDFNVGKLSYGEHEVTLLVDCFDEVSEKDESDNLKTITITVDYPTGSVFNSDKNSTKIWPNPSSSELYVDFGERVSTTLELFDISGRLIFQKEMNDEQLSRISTKEFVNGTYFLRTSGEDAVLNEKVVISH